MKTIMTGLIVSDAGAIRIGTIFNGRPDYVSAAILSTPGFYFLVSTRTGLVHARYFVGDTRSKVGFQDTLNSIASRRTSVTAALAKGEYAIYFLPPEKMKPLTTGFGKGQIKMAFTKNHSSPYQTLSEMNRLLNDNFKFVLQKY